MRRHERVVAPDGARDARERLAPDAPPAPASRPGLRGLRPSRSQDKPPADHHRYPARRSPRLLRLSTPDLTAHRPPGGGRGGLLPGDYVAAADDAADRLAPDRVGCQG